MRIPLMEVVEESFGKNAPEGQYLPIALSAAIPLWMMKFDTYTAEQRADELKRLEADDFCLRMEYVLHQGPKKGDTAQSFNDLAKSVALLSLCPGGVTVFGQHYDWEAQKKKVQRISLDETPKKKIKRVEL